MARTLYGSFSLGNTGALGSPAVTQPNLSTSVLVESFSAGGILFVYMTEHGLASPQGAHQLVSRFDISLMSGAISPISLRTNTTPALSGPFSDTAVYEIVANGEGSTNASIGISTILSSAPPAVPEPASLVLLGVGLAGLGLFFRTRTTR